MPHINWLCKRAAKNIIKNNVVLFDLDSVATNAEKDIDDKREERFFQPIGAFYSLSSQRIGKNNS